MFFGGNMQKKTIYFVHDLLCSWCYGFEPIMQKFVEKYHIQYHIIFVSCGLFIYKNKRPVQELIPADYRSMYQHVIGKSGADIREVYFTGLIDEQNYVLNSEITAISLNVFKEYYPDNPFKQIEYTSEFQKLIYQLGMNPNDEAIYKTIAIKMEIDPKEFWQKMQDPKYWELAKQDFKLTRNGFHNKRLPSLYLEQCVGKYENFVSGFMAFEQVEQQLEELLKIKQEFRFQGLWQLQPKYSKYEFGIPPREGLYELQLDDLGWLTVNMHWISSIGHERKMEFRGRLNEGLFPYDADKSADMIGFELNSPNILTSSAFKNGEKIAWAERYLDSTGNRLTITIFGRLKDGRIYQNKDIFYRL